MDEPQNSVVREKEARKRKKEAEWEYFIDKRRSVVAWDKEWDREWWERGIKRGDEHVHYFHCSDDFIGVFKRQNFTNYTFCVMLIICQIFLHKSVLRNLSGVPSINY